MWSESDLDQIIGEIILKDIEINDEIEYMVSNWIDLQEKFGEMVGEKKKISLSRALYMTGAEFVGKQHDALYDSRNTAEVYRAMNDRDAEESLLLRSYRVSERVCARLSGTKKVLNHGEVGKIVVQGKHKPIVTKEDFSERQLAIKRDISSIESENTCLKTIPQMDEVDVREKMNTLKGALEEQLDFENQGIPDSFIDMFVDEIKSVREIGVSGD